MKARWTVASIVKTYPTLSSAQENPDGIFEGGHLWLQELLDGSQLRFRIDDAGSVRFGDATTTFPPGEVPFEYRHATRFVREALDYEALRATDADLGSVVFFTEAMHKRATEYDWDRTPSVLGFDVWDGAAERFLPPDAVEQAFERLGLPPVNTFAREVRAVDFDPDSYAIPRSNWRDGRAYGVVIRSKTGGRAVMYAHTDGEAEGDPLPDDPIEFTRQFASPARLERIQRTLSERGRPVDAATLFDAAFEELVRRHHQVLVEGEDEETIPACRSELSARVNEYLA